MCYREDKTADFVGLQRFVGRLGSRSGSFVMQTQGSFDGTEAKGSLAVVAGSGTRGAERASRARARSPPRWGPRRRSSSTTTSSSSMPALARDGNVLGALSLVVADQMSDAVAAAADQSLTAAAALSALEHFADGCSVDRLRRILGLTSSGTVRLVDRLVTAGEVRRREGPDARTTSIVLTAAGRRVARRVGRRPDGRTTSIELTAAGRRAARRVTAARAGVLEDALVDLSPAERDDLERLAARALDGVVRQKLAREAATPRAGSAGCATCRHVRRAEGRCPAAGGGCCCCCCAGLVRRRWRRLAARNSIIEGEEMAVGARGPRGAGARTAGLTGTNPQAHRPGLAPALPLLDDAVRENP